MTWDTGYGPQPYASATYTAAGQLWTLSYGAGTETRSYNNLMQLINISVPGYLNMTYSYVPGQNNGRIASSGDGIMGESVSYTYDALNRLTAASSGAWSEQYGFDGFGNLTSKTGTGGSPNAAPSMTASYDVHNHLTNATYDANGNQTSLPGFTQWYSMENRVSAQYSTAWPFPDSFYAYDPNGKRVMKETNPDPRNLNTGSNPTFEFYMYGITGQRLVTVDCNYSWQNPVPNCWVVGENVYFGGKMLVSNGVSVVTDRLGSVRANTQGERFAYYPYGEERTSTVDGRDKFATYFRDGVGQDYAGQRYYNAGMGRFWSPDPHIGGSAVEPASWNRYAYAGGDPVNFSDPRGLFRNIVGNCDALLNGYPQDGCDEDGGGDYGGSGCTYDALGFEESPLCSEYGDQTTQPPELCIDVYTPLINGASHVDVLLRVLNENTFGGASQLEEDEDIVSVPRNRADNVALGFRLRYGNSASVDDQAKYSGGPNQQAYHYYNAVSLMNRTAFLPVGAPLCQQFLSDIRTAINAMDLVLSGQAGRDDIFFWFASSATPTAADGKVGTLIETWDGTSFYGIEQPKVR